MSSTAVGITSRRTIPCTLMLTASPIAAKAPTWARSVGRSSMYATAKVARTNAGRNTASVMRISEKKNAGSRSVSAAASRAAIGGTSRRPQRYTGTAVSAIADAVIPFASA